MSFALVVAPLIGQAHAHKLVDRLLRGKAVLFRLFLHDRVFVDIALFRLDRDRQHNFFDRFCYIGTRSGGFLLFLFASPPAGFCLLCGSGKPFPILAVIEAELFFLLLFLGSLSGNVFLALVRRLGHTDGLAGDNIVDHTAEHTRAGLVQLFQRALDLGKGGVVKADDEQHRARHLIEAQRAGDEAHRRRIQNHVLILLLEVLHQLHEHVVHTDGIVLQHCGQQIKVTGEGRNGLLREYIAAIESVERMIIIHFVEKQGAESRVAGIKVNKQRLVLHV